MPASSLSAGALKALVSEQENQTLSVPKLSYQQCSELLRDSYVIAKKPMVLVLDAFEQLPDPFSLQTTLSRFLRYIESWPPLHILIAIRHEHSEDIPPNEIGASICVDDLKKESGMVNVYELGAFGKESVKKKIAENWSSSFAIMCRSFRSTKRLMMKKF
ncbi:MAG: hypothetical protein ACMUIU_06140 [bacterium]